MNKLKSLLNTSFVRYVIVGGIAFVVEYLFYQLLYRFLGLDYSLASVIVYSIMFWLVFLLNRQWSFQSEGNFKGQLFKYFLLFLFNNLVANILLMQFLVEQLNISADLAPILKMLLVVIWNYYIYKYFIYK